HTRFSRDWSSDVCSSDLTDVRPCSDISSSRSTLVAQVVLPISILQSLLHHFHIGKPSYGFFRTRLWNWVPRPRIYHMLIQHHVRATPVYSQVMWQNIE